MSPIAKLASWLFAIVLLGLLGVHAAPAPVPVPNSFQPLPQPIEAAQGAEPLYWPEEVVPAKRETNQERLRRGLGPLPPARLFERTPTVTHQLVPRISPVAQSAPGGFTFAFCGTAGTATVAPTTITATSPQDAANQCAVIVGTSLDMLIYPRPANSWQCYRAPRGVASAPCTATNYGYYTRPSVP